MNDTVEIEVIVGDVLGVKVARGFARLCDLAAMSRADIYDPATNPTGTQRDLSPRHARDAYTYVGSNQLAFWPEVLLCARIEGSVSLTPIKGMPSRFILRVDLSRIRRSQRIAISRLDGNHRLHYADGKTEGFPPITKSVSFCLALGLSLDDEIKLFRDINNNQRKMNTSHLDNIMSRLSPSQRLQIDSPALYIAQKLSADQQSPLYGRIYTGGPKKRGVVHVPLRTLKTGIEYLFSRTTRLRSLPDVDARYRVIRNYFDAVRAWQPEAWEHPERYLMLRGVGIWALSFLGATVIDHALSLGAYKKDELLRILRSGRAWDWSRKGEFAGFSGRSGALKISEMIGQELEAANAPSIKALYSRIMEDR